MGVKLARHRNSGYFVRAFVSSGEKQYNWVGTKGNKTDIKEVPKEVYEYLTMNSRCLDQGELVLVDDNEDIEELKNSIVDRDSYDKNTHTKAEVEKILKGNFPKMKKTLNDITVDSERQFIINVAKEMSGELAKGKIDFLSEWMGIDSDILFD